MQSRDPAHRQSHVTYSFQILQVFFISQSLQSFFDDFHNLGGVGDAVVMPQWLRVHTALAEKELASLKTYMLFKTTNNSRPELFDTLSQPLWLSLCVHTCVHTHACAQTHTHIHTLLKEARRFGSLSLPDFKFCFLISFRLCVFGGGILQKRFFF